MSPNDHLLLIAIGGYAEWPPLRGPRKDADALRDVLLQRYGFRSENTVELRDSQATAAAILRTLRGFKDCPPEDRLLIYYAGHGYTDEFDGTGYWIPHDAERDTDGRGHWIGNAAVRGALRALPLRHILVCCDSCFSGDLLDERRNLDGKRPSDYIAQATRKRSREVLTSGASEPVFDANLGGHSPFAFHLIDTLKSCSDDWIDTLRLYDHIRSGVTGQQPLYGALPSAGHQRGGAFLLTPIASKIIQRHRQPEDHTVSNPHYSEDLAVYIKSGYDPQRYLPAGSVVIVTGAHTMCELFDRPLAEKLRDSIEARSAEKGGPRRAVVLSDIWYNGDAYLQRYPVVSIGGPGVNSLTNALLNAADTAESVGEDGLICLRGSTLALWGTEAPQTKAAVEAFETERLATWVETLPCWPIAVPLILESADRPGEVLDVVHCSDDNGAALQFWERNDTPNQQWLIEPLDGDDAGFCRIVNVRSRKCLEVKVRSSENCAPVIQWEDQGGWNQQWKIQRQDDGAYRIDNRESGKSLDRAQRSPSQGLIQYDWHGGPNQRWHLYSVGAE